jgi:hypothetical protein
VTVSLRKKPEKLFGQLSRLKGPQASLREIKAVMAAAGLKEDRVLTRRSLRLMHRFSRVLKAALPNTDPEIIGGVCADLLDLWETGQTLDKKLKENCKLRFPRDRERLQDFLSWIDAIQLKMAGYWIDEIQKDLPKLRRSLRQANRNERRRTRTSPPKHLMGREQSERSRVLSRTK